jgi:uncharacterized membrane protein
MFEYTKAAFNKTIEDFKRLDYIRQILTQIVYIAYLIYALVVAKNYIWANIPLLLLSVGYFVLFLYATAGKEKKKKLKTKAEKAYNFCKKIIKVFTLGVTVYGFFLTANHVTPLSLLLVSMMIVAWILEIVFGVIAKIFISRIHLFTTGFETDMENLKKPVTTVSNFFKKLSGQDVPPAPVPTKQQLILEKQLLLVFIFM